MTKDQIAKGLFVASGSLLWAVLGLSLWLADYDPQAIALLFALVFATIALLAWKVHPHFAHLVPIWGEALRVQRILARREGNRWLREVSLLPRSNNTDYRAFMGKRGGNMTLTMTGVPVSDSALQNKARDYLGNFDAKRFAYSRTGETVRIVWLKRDPLDEVFNSLESPSVDVASMSVNCLRGDTGPLPLSFKEVSGVVVSGMPGTGKSVSMRSPFEALDKAEGADVTVLDCKGGNDWKGLSHVVAFDPLKADLDNLATASLVVDEMHAEMLKRYADGITQFWSLPPESRPPFRLLVVDESQELFEASTDPAVKKARASLTAKVSALVKKGRGAGVCVALLSQKQTADAIPTAIRDNATMKVAFRLATREAVVSALGRASDEGEANPLDIPLERRGGAVVEVNGIRQHVRFMSPATPTP